MEYKVVMPVLSDTMDKGVIVKWHKKTGDFVKKGEVLAEVESDKAVIEVESFYDGYITILAKENEEVPVKSVIAVIDDSKPAQKPEIKPTKSNSSQKVEKPKETKPKPAKPIKIPTLPSGTASPKAKKLANEFNIDLTKIPNTPIHEKDVLDKILNRYFTPKAKNLAIKYNITDKFEFNRKISFNDVMKFIKENNIPKISEISPNQKAIIKNLTNSLTKPTFRIYDEIEITPSNYKITTLLLKRLANTMKYHPKSRTIIKDDKFYTFESINISVAVDREDGLYMMVLKNVDNLSLDEIEKWLKDVKTKRITISDLNDSTFGISNLGMFGIESFDSIINKNDSAIISFGALKDNKIKITASFDHRIFNGVEAAKFIQQFKEMK